MYWYAKRNVDPARIAAALNLPIKTVQHLIDILGEEKKPDGAKHLKKQLPFAAEASSADDFLDLFAFTKTRYTVVDISGSIVKQYLPKLRELLLKVGIADRKPFALKMTDVALIDESGIAAIKTLYTGFKHQGRYCAILDPSPAVESVIKQHGLDTIIPIFGTEIAFEEKACR